MRRLYTLHAFQRGRDIIIKIIKAERRRGAETGNPVEMRSRGCPVEICKRNSLRRVSRSKSHTSPMLRSGGGYLAWIVGNLMYRLRVQ